MYLFIYLSIYQSIIRTRWGLGPTTDIHISIYLSIYLSIVRWGLGPTTGIHISIYLSITTIQCINVSIYLSINLSIYLSIYLSIIMTRWGLGPTTDIHMYIYLFIYNYHSMYQCIYISIYQCYLYNYQLLGGDWVQPLIHIQGVPQKMLFSDFLALTDAFWGFGTATSWLPFNLNGGRQTDILL